MQNDRIYKIIVAHPERQHSFRVASALKKNGMLCKYVTTVYDKPASIIMRTVKKFLSDENQKRANGRYNADLSDEDVVQFCELRGLIQIALYRFDKSKVIYNWWHKKTSKKFGKKVAKLAMKENADAVILYDANARTCFKILGEKAPNIVRIMDTSAANRLFMKSVYEKDMEICPSFADKLKTERNFMWHGNYCKLLKEELEATDYFLSPSDFVKNSLLYSGIRDEQIKICPYGTNFTIQDEEVDLTRDIKLPLRAIYVGNITEMKGIYYLLEAIMEIPKEQLQLKMVGHFENCKTLLDKYSNRVDFIGRVTHDEVKSYLLESDVFVFPSLGEGMSLSVLEAMACGLPCLVTENSGVSSAIKNYENGFEVKAQDKEALKEKMIWFINNINNIRDMRRESFNVAKEYSWDKYEINLTEILKSIL